MTQSINPNDKIEATNDPELAKLHGLSEWDEQRGQYVAPRGPGEHSNREGDGTEQAGTAGQNVTDLNAKREQADGDAKSPKAKR